MKPKMLLHSLVVVMVSLHLTLQTEGADYHININAGKITANLTHFWESTGFCPPDPHKESFKYFLSEDEVQNLAYIGSVPHSGIKQVRIHWLLDMVTVSTTGADAMTYNFTLLDQLIDTIYQNKLKPGFELMGNPSDWWTDFENRQQVYQWKDLVATLANRYIDKYGIDYVATWNFETWNEPDHKDFDKLNFTVQGFLNYYDACSEGLRAASTKLILGGPGAACRKPSYSVICWALLDHCDNGINYFTYQAGVRLDYIAFHQKGEGSSMFILDSELDKIDAIHTTYPGLAKVPIFNDEADPLVGWSKHEDWRADATYAAVVAKVIAQHQNLLLTKRPDIYYALLSNDNGFMNWYPSFFEQRTLLARFQINNTKPNYVDFIKKPVLSVMGLLALLGDQQIDASISIQNGNTYIPVSNTSDVGVIASVGSAQKGTDSWQMVVLIYNSADTSNVTGTDDIKLDIKGLDKGTDRLYSLYLLDNQHGNPYDTWISQGKPIFPTRKQLQNMRNQQEPVRIKGPVKLANPSLTLDLSLSKPGVVLLQVCAKPSTTLGKVADVRLHNITSGDTLVIWDDINVGSQCLLTYVVEFSSTGKESSYTRINKQDIIFTSFVHSVNMKQDFKYKSMDNGWYRVYAVDYWGRKGPYSTPVNIVQSSH